MKKIFAVPTENKKACAHFGHCETFAIVAVENGEIVQEYYIEPPEHQPGTYPRFLVGLGVQTVIAGGMGVKAQTLFTENNISVVMGAGVEDPSKLVLDYEAGNLESGSNACDH